MYCHKCGAKITQAEGECPQCGQPLASKETKKRLTKRQLIFLGGAAALIIAAVILIFVWVLPWYHYSNGISSLEEKDYKAAYESLYQAGDWSDAPQLLEQFLVLPGTEDHNGEVYQYTYNDRGDMTAKVMGEECSVKWEYEYDAQDQIVKMIKSGQENGKSFTHTDEYTYDQNGKRIKEYLKREETLGGAASLKETTFLYTFDQAGNCTKKDADYRYRLAGQELAETETTFYSYEGTRLIKESRLDAQKAEVEVITYAYDKNGNLTEQVRVFANGKTTMRYERDEQGNLLKSEETTVFKSGGKNESVITYTLDGDGNVLEQIEHKSREGQNAGESETVTTYTRNEYGQVTEELSVTDEVRQETVGYSDYQYFYRPDLAEKE